MDSHLLLWRHAEASLGIEDINRDLTDKGKLDGKKIAELLAKNYTNISLFCSNAIRTINTSNYLVNILPKIKTYYFCVCASSFCSNKARYKHNSR